MLALRIATQDDEPVMRALMQRAITDLLTPFLPAEGVAASFEVMAWIASGSPTARISR